MEENKSTEGILSRIVSALGGIASAIQQVASFLRAQTLSHSHTGGTDGQQISNAGISASAAIAISKTTLETFTDLTAWTPTITATGGGFSLGNGTVSGKYTQIGKLVVATFIFTFGSTSNMGAGALRSTMPVASNTASESAVNIGNCRSIKPAVSEDEGHIYAYGSDLIGFTNSAGNGTLVGVGVPFTWTDGCQLQGQFIYFAE